MFHLCRQRLVEFSEYVIHTLAEEPVHFPESAAGVERSHVEIIPLDMDGRDDVVTDHSEPTRRGCRRGFSVCRRQWGR
jgi:hypothetical protein